MGGAQMTCPAWILSLMLSLPGWHLDRHESRAQRVDLYTPVAEAICKATKARRERIFLTWQAWEETRYARAVLEWRCEDMPPTANCDGLTSIGPWQNKQRWCPIPWDEKRSTVDRYVGGARCALRQYWYGWRRCKTLEGAFHAQRGSMGCKSDWAKARALRLEGKAW